MKQAALEHTSQLTNEQLTDLRDSLRLSTLEKAVELIYLNGTLRPLYGENSVMLRTLGNNFSFSRYQHTYYDSFRDGEAMTEFAEFMQALADFDRSKTRDALVELILEAGDILYQSVVIDSKHRENPRYPEARDSIDSALGYVKKELENRGILFEKVRKLASMKYWIRGWMGTKGLPSKNKELEFQLCTEALEG